MFDALDDFSESIATQGRYAHDKGLMARFYSKPIKDEEASTKAGRYVAKEVVFIEIRTPGYTGNTIDRKASEDDKQRFRRQYERFVEGNAETEDGTPLEECTWINRAMVEELAHMRIRTVEVLANVPDDACGRVPGLYDLKRKASVFLEKAEQNAPITELAAKNELLEGQVEALTRQLQGLVEAQKKATKS